MRLPRLLNAPPRRGRATAVACWGLVASLGVLTGCDVQSFADPAETGGTRLVRDNGKPIQSATTGDPLVVNILEDLDPVLEEGTREFVNAEPPRPEDLVTTPADYVISPGDVVTITVSELQGPGLDTVKTTNVSGTGNITLPLLDNPVRAEGMTENELQRAIADAYRQAGIQERAQVSVSVVQARGRSYSVLGAVGGGGGTGPGTFVITTEDFRLLDALSQAGSVSNPLLEDLYILRKPQPAARGGGAGGGAGGDATTAPATAPEGAADPADDLAPPPPPQSNSRRQPRQMRRAAYLQAEGAADPLDPAAGGEAGEEPAPADVPAGEEMPEDDDPSARVGRVDGEGVVVQPGEDAPAPAGGAEMAPAGGAAQPFEFDDMPATESVRVIRIPVRKLLGGDLRYNVAIRPRDTIIVPPGSVGFYYMEGHVAAPGAYQLTGARVTLREAIWSARGLDALAIPQRTDIIRKISDTEKMYVRVDLARIFAGRAPDIYLKPGDEVNVGTNFLAPFLAAARSGFRMTYGFGFLYDRNYGEDDDRRR